MANIPVERSGGGVPWWAWLLGLLALLLIGAALLRGCDDDTDSTDVAVVDDTGVSSAGTLDDGTATGDGSAAGTTAGAVATGDTFSSLDDLNVALNDGAASSASLAGRMVTLTDVEVTSVVGDSTFYVGTGNDRVLVVLQDEGEQAAGAAGSDGRYNVDTGDRVTVRGRVQSYQAGMRGLGALGAEDVTLVERRRYVVVTDPGGLSSAGGTSDATTENAAN